MKKSLANQIAKVWNELHAGNTAETMTTAQVSEDSVEIVPTANNDGTAFYHVEDFADVMRTFRVSGYVVLRAGKLIAKLY